MTTVSARARLVTAATFRNGFVLLEATGSVLP